MPYRILYRVCLNKDFKKGSIKGILKKGSINKVCNFLREKKKCQPTKKAKTRKTQNGVDKNGKVQKLEKIKKLNKNDCHKKHIKKVLDDASAAPYKHSTT